MTQTADVSTNTKKAAIITRIGLVSLILAVPPAVVFGLHHYGFISLPSPVLKSLVVSAVVLIAAHFALRIVAAKVTTTQNTKEDNE